MKVLITGGCGFIGSHVAERFAKEGHSVYIIDNLSTGKLDNLHCKYKLYNINIADKRCSEIFRLHNFDIVINLAGKIYVNESDYYLGSETDLLGLVNMLTLANRFKVKKFIFISSGEVYGNAQTLPTTEAAKLKPLSDYGINKVLGEAYCRNWQNFYNLDIAIVRLAAVYGPRQRIHPGRFAVVSLIKAIMTDQEVIVSGNGSETADYIYVEDAAFAIYQIASKNIADKIINVSTSTETSMAVLLKKMPFCQQTKQIRFGEISDRVVRRARLDNTLLCQNTGWQPKYTLEQGLAQTYEWCNNELDSEANKPEFSIRKAFSAALPYVENLGLFALVTAFTLGGYFSLIDTRLGIDYNYIYIALLGFLYGKRQSMIATFLASLLFTAGFLMRGGDWVALLYQSQYLVHLATYLCIGIVTGYAIDNKNRIIDDTAHELSRLKDRYEFLEKIHLEVNDIKDGLYGQIINSDDSIGRIYSIVRKLDSLEIEKIFTAATEIVRDIMKAEMVALYTVNKYETYLRLKTRVSMEAHKYYCTNSLKIEQHSYLNTVITNKCNFINKELDPNLPAMVAPIIHEDQVIAIVEIHGLAFESFTLYHENLFRIIILLITDALIKAYLYDQSQFDKKQITNTQILIPAEFNKVLTEIETRRELFDQSMALLKIAEKTSDYEVLYQKISALLRAEDYVGLKDDGYVYILLVNTTKEGVAIVQDRLQKNGITTIQV